MRINNILHKHHRGQTGKRIAEICTAKKKKRNELKLK